MPGIHAGEPADENAGMMRPHGGEGRRRSGDETGRSGRESCAHPEIERNRCRGRGGAGTQGSMQPRFVVPGSGGRVTEALGAAISRWASRVGIHERAEKLRRITGHGRER